MFIIESFCKFKVLFSFSRRAFIKIGEDRLNIKTQLIIGALKFAEFLDHISIDYVVMLYRKNADVYNLKFQSF